MTTRLATRPSRQARSIALPADAGPVDRVARVRIEAVEIQSQKDAGALEGQVKSLLGHVKELVADPDLASGPRDPAQPAPGADPARAGATQVEADRRPRRHASIALVDAIEVELEGIFQKVLERQPEIRSSGLPELCRSSPVPSAARSLPAGDRGGAATARRLAAGEPDPGDGVACRGRRDGPLQAGRRRPGIDKSATHVQALLASSEPRFQGLGHLFQGAIDLEQSGLIRAAAQAGRKNEMVQPAQPKLRASA